MKTFSGRKKFLAIFLGGVITLNWAAFIYSRDALGMDKADCDRLGGLWCKTSYGHACDTDGECDEPQGAGVSPLFLGTTKKPASPDVKAATPGAPAAKPATAVPAAPKPAAPAAAELGLSVDPGLLREGLITFGQFKDRMERRAAEGGSLTCPDTCPGDCHMACCWFCQPSFCGAICGPEPAAIE